jgi:hypothetical protein
MTSKGFLANLTRLMIPADRQRGLPDGSEVHLSDVISNELDHLRLEAMAREIDGFFQDVEQRSLSSMVPAEFELLIRKYRAKLDPTLREVGRYLLMAYYTDDRVRDAIGVGRGAPFPTGYEVLAGNLELLEPVYVRGPIYRAVQND